MVHMDNFTF